MKRQYYLVKIPSKESRIKDGLLLGISTDCRRSLDGKYLILKTNKKRIKRKIDKGFKKEEILPIKLFKKLSHKEVLELMATKEWQSQEVL